MAYQDDYNNLLLKLKEALDRLADVKSEVFELRAAIRRQTLKSDNDGQNNRDRYIYAKYLLGHSFEELSKEYQLSITRIRDICSLEKLKLKREAEK